MNDQIINASHRLLNNTKYSTHRYLYNTFNLSSRLTGIVGPRGAGKTTLMVQYINEKMDNKQQCIYVSLDHIYFTQKKLIEFIDEMYEIKGIRYFFLDEVHKYPDWERELKNIYDTFTDVLIVCSGSSSINLERGTFDLSRRCVLYQLNGLSFREYLEFSLSIQLAPTTFDELINQPDQFIKKLPVIDRIRGHFLEYLENGYYPFLFEDSSNYHQKLLNVIDKTIYQDIAHFYNMKTSNLIYFKKITSYLATIPPSKLNRNNIAKHIWHYVEMRG